MTAVVPHHRRTSSLLKEIKGGVATDIGAAGRQGARIGDVAEGARTRHRHRRDPPVYSDTRRWDQAG